MKIMIVVIAVMLAFISRPYAQESRPPLSAAEFSTLEDAAGRGDAQAQSRIGDAYLLGSGVPQDYEKARAWYERAAAQGDAKAQFSLGVIYHEGFGVSQDYGKARSWYEKAAAQGLSDAQFNLGVIYEKGLGVPQDEAKAREWYGKVTLPQPFQEEIQE